ncbi:MAG: sigma-54 dependent transcriptional regulator [Clostridiaceae bacterium]|nr:sigma-54 dependent transcriptional regulator [Clostridiaceae bacterium]
MKPSVLIVDDEPSICASLSFALCKQYQVKTALTTAEGLALAYQESFDVALLDLRIGEDDGIELLQRIREVDPAVVVIMMTAYGSIRSSVEAMQKGAFTYLTKPLDLEELQAFVSQAVEFRALKEQVSFLTDELKNRQFYDRMVGESAPMQAVYRMIDRLRDVDTNVLILGESGTGKELVARAIHNLGKRQKSRFVVVNCAAIPENLLEAEFFGYRRGAFTGALQDRKGKFELADKGTIFLDEIGDMPLSLQAKLLRVLESKEFSPLGGSETKHVDVRVLAATNRDLKEMIQAGSFRQDLYYRLNVMKIKIPPLRQRKEDIPLLSQHFVQQFAKEQNKQIKAIEPETERIMMRFDFPGNVRQLANVLEYAVIVCADGVIRPKDLPDDIRISRSSAEAAAEVPARGSLAGISLRELERIAITDTLVKNSGRRDQTARDLGISTRGLLNKINEYGLDRHNFPE